MLKRLARFILRHELDQKSASICPEEPRIQLKIDRTEYERFLSRYTIPIPSGTTGKEQYQFRLGMEYMKQEFRQWFVV